jgi:hypothetical protein
MPHPLLIIGPTSLCGTTHTQSPFAIEVTEWLVDALL